MNLLSNRVCQDYHSSCIEALLSKYNFKKCLARLKIQTVFSFKTYTIVHVFMSLLFKRDKIRNEYSLIVLK